MNSAETLFLSLGLSMDAVAVSIASGFVTKDHKIRHAFKMAVFFGVFQAAMPLAGWGLGLSFRSLIAGFDHWVAFGLLAIIGARMIREAGRPDVQKKTLNPFETKVLLVLAVATSIDALAAGLGFAVLKLAIVPTVLTIGGTTFLLSFFGLFTGKKFGHLLENKVKIIGGLILIAIGIKILIEHLT